MAGGAAGATAAPPPRAPATGWSSAPRNAVGAVTSRYRPRSAAVSAPVGREILATENPLRTSGVQWRASPSKPPSCVTPMCDTTDAVEGFGEDKAPRISPFFRPSRRLRRRLGRKKKRSWRDCVPPNVPPGRRSCKQCDRWKTADEGRLIRHSSFVVGLLLWHAAETQQRAYAADPRDPG